LTIFKRDFVDAVRDARVLVALLVPFGIGVFYNFTFDDTAPQPEATLAYSSAADTQLPELLREIAGDGVKLTIDRTDTPDQVRDRVNDGDADVGLIVPAGFDDAVRNGQAPPLSVLQPEKTEFATQYLISALTPALRQMAGQQPPATIQIETTEKAPSSTSLIEDLGLRKYFVLAALIMQIAMITMYGVPYILAEESERHTLDALVMVASYREVLVAKSLFGLAYVAISTPILLAITRISPTRPLLFAAGILLLSVMLTGVGLLLGGTLKVTQLTAWGGVLVLPVIVPAFMAGLPVPHWADILILLLPTTHGMRLAVDGISDTTIFGEWWLSFVVIIIWGIITYGATLWALSRRQT
jgi:ABC-2 type transport system permease protein